MARMTFEKWWRTYKPIPRRPQDPTPFGSSLYDGWNERQKLQAYKYCLKNPRGVWTFMDLDEKFYIVAGWGLANRIGYFLCSVPFDDETTAPEIPLGPLHGRRIRSLGCCFASDTELPPFVTTDQLS